MSLHEIDLVTGMSNINAERKVLEDLDLTPKAVKQPARTTSVGEFLKSEFHSTRGSTDSDISINLAQLNTQGERLSPPKLPERRLSKSKTFFNFGGRKDKEPKPIRRVNSTTSKNTLVRRFSRGANRSSSSASAYTESINSTDSSYSLKNMNSKDIASVTSDARIPSYDRGSSSSRNSGFMQSWPAYAREEFILCPEIRITPEVLSLDGGSTNLWVAVEVMGTLRLANILDQTPATFQEERRTISGDSAGMSFV